jgi:cation/acetate symporter
MFPYASPALFSMLAAFLTIYLVSKFDNSKQAQLERSLYPAQKVRSETGLGSASASGH